MADPTLKSFVDAKHGAWKDRKISLWGTARSVISQLRTGQEMTRVSLPSIFLEPYSILELASSRYMGYLDQLQNLHTQKDPLQKMVMIIRWFLAAYCELDFEKKPYNAILGETHQCVIRPGDDDSTGATFLAEQITHHPPLSAFVVNYPSENIVIEGNVVFAVKFHGNSVTSVADGFANLTLNDDEVYRIGKGLPDVHIQNVVIGTRVTSWAGEVEVTCEKTGYRAVLNFKRKKKNTVTGEIYHKGYKAGAEPQYTFDGAWGDEPIYMQPAGEGEKVFLFDATNVRKNTLIYPPAAQLPDNDSLKIWHDVTTNIVADDLEKADAAKQIIEAEQRLRIKAGAEELDAPRRFFTYNADAGIWKWNGQLYNSINGDKKKTKKKATNKKRKASVEADEKVPITAE